MNISLIIPFYRQVKNIRLILKALENQSYKDFEVILADDDFHEPTKKDILKLMANSPLDITYIRQTEDNGFTKNKIFNKSIAIAKGDFFVFLDGDCLPHRHFMSEYHKVAVENKMFFGRRVYLSKFITEKLYNTENLQHLTFLNLLFSGSKKIKEGIYLPTVRRNIIRMMLGCNMGIPKEKLLEINGFDEDFKTASFGEDVDIEWRLLATGITQESVKNKAICYHLYHERGYTDNHVDISRNLMHSKQQEGKVYCENGLDKYLNFGNFKETYPEVYFNRIKHGQTKILLKKNQITQG